MKKRRRTPPSKRILDRIVMLKKLKMKAVRNSRADDPETQPAPEPELTADVLDALGTLDAFTRRHGYGPVEPGEG